MLVDAQNDATPFTEEEKQAATAQLERLLANPHFSNSRRFPAFLRFIVTQTLSGHTDLLKERTLGVEVFGKRANYDTANDPIVRVTAAEIRKRIAQYYQDPAHDQELRLLLPPGSYVPRFDTPHKAVAEPPQPILNPDVAEPVGHSPSPTQLDAAQAAHLARHQRAVRLLTALVLVLIAVGGFAWWWASRPTPVATFWRPVVSSSDPILFCIADQTQYTAISLRDAIDPNHQQVLHDNLTAIVFDDVKPLVEIAGLLTSYGKKYSIRSEGSTTLMDLRSGPTIFVGAYDNQWTLRLLKPLRFHFVNDPSMTHFGIVDTASKAPSPWIVDRTQQIATNNYRDYAIVARFTDTTTGQLAIVAAGIGRGGTIAAGDFLTDSAQIAPILRAVGSKRNIELVLSTPIIGGEPGTARVEAAYTW